VVAQDGNTEFGVTRSIWLMLDLSNVLVSDTPPRQVCLVSCILSAEIITKTTLGQDTTVDNVVRTHKDPGLPYGYFPNHWAWDRSHGPPASTDRLKSSAGPQRRAQAGELDLRCALVEAIVDGSRLQ
jgi:hypothetical protein